MRDASQAGSRVVDDFEGADPDDLAEFEAASERVRDTPRPAEIESALATIFEGPDDDAGFEATRQLLDAAAEVSSFAERECGIDPDSLLSDAPQPS